MQKTYLLDESKDVTHRLLERFLVNSKLAGTEVGDDVLEIVVEGVLLGAELLEEEPREVADPRGGVFDALGHLAELTFNFDHAVEDEMGEDHERVLLDVRVRIGQALVETIARIGKGMTGKCVSFSLCRR
jgi:hypothetical protein